MIKRLAFLGLLPLALIACQPEQQSAPAAPAAPATAPSIDLTTQTIPDAGVVITNAHILDGTGNEIANGSIVIEGNRIVSVNSGNVDVAGALVVDAQGYTVMPGFIDGHRHIIRGDADTWLAEEAADRMREFLESGFTTVASMGDDEAGIIELKRRTASGEIAGPRILSAGRAPIAGPFEWLAPRGGDPARFDPGRSRWYPTVAADALPEEQLRARVQEIAAAGHEYVKTNILVTPGGPEVEGLRIVADEARRQGLISSTHAISNANVLAAIEAGTDAINHTPHIEEFITQEQAQLIADSGIPMLSTLGIFTPFYHEGEEPLFRDGLPTPIEDISSAGIGPVNAFMIANAGTVYGFGTDVSYHPAVTLESELSALFSVFSKEAIIKIMGENTSIGLHQDDIGTLQAGKLADIVFVNGNPLDNLYYLMDVHVVMKDGQFLIDQR